MQATAVMPGELCQRIEFGGGNIGQRVCFEIAPEGFDRIQFRSIGREKLQMDPRMALEPSAQGPGSVTG